MKETENRGDESTGLDGCPLIEAVRWQANLVHGLLMPCVRIEIAGAHAVIELVYLVRHGKLRCLLGHLVDLCVDSRTRLGVSFIKMLLIESGNLVEIGFFGSIVESAERLIAFE